MKQPRQNTNNLQALLKFLRVEYLAVAVFFPLMGAAVSAGGLTAPRLAALLGVALAFHLYVSVLNDIADLPLDRTNPARAGYPLVSGRVSVRAALLFVLLQVPLAAALIAWQDGSWQVYAALALALGMMTIYNLWGKRTPFPLLIDVIQGIGFSALSLFGAALCGGLTALSWLGFATGVVWMVLINLLGGLRDLHNDQAFGVFTSPMMLGGRANGDNTQHLPALLRGYGYSLQLLLIALGGLITWMVAPQNWRLPLALLSAGLGGLALLLLVTLFGLAAQDYEAMISAGLWQMGVSATSLVLPLLFLLPAWVAILLMVHFFIVYRDRKIQPMLAYWRRRRPVEELRKG